MRNQKKDNIVTVSFFSKRTKMENGRVVSDEGGFYLEKSDDIKSLCYRKGNFEATMIVSRKTYQRLKSLTSGIILERAKSAMQLLDEFAGDCRDDCEGDPFKNIFSENVHKFKNRLYTSYASHKPKEPKDIAPFIIQIFSPE